MTKPMNVCLMNDSFPPVIDGVANAVSNYAEIITKKYGKAVVVTPFYPEADDSTLPYPVIRYPSLDTTRLVGYRTGYPFSPEVAVKLKSEHIDIIHTHCPVVSTLLARTMRDILGVPVVFTYHTKFDIDICNAVKWKLFQEEAEKLLVENIEACDEVWVVSSGAGDNLRGLGYQGDYTVMPNGVDLPRGRLSREEQRSAVSGYSIPEGVPVFLFVGRMMWYKGIRIIIDALARLKEQGRAFCMVFVGDGEDRAEIEAYAKETNVFDKCVFTGAVCEREAIRAWYSRADLFLFPSTFDTNGLVVREAAACGLASVLVRGSCAAEGIEDGKTGFLIEESAESMAAVLSRACLEPDALRRVGDRAMRDIYVSWEESVEKAYARYQVILDGFHSRNGECAVKDTEAFRRQAELLSNLADAKMLRQSRKSEMADQFGKLREAAKLKRRHITDKSKSFWQNYDRFL